MSVNRKQPYFSLYSKSLELYNLPFPAEDFKSAKSMIKASVVTGKDQYLATCLDDFDLCLVGYFCTDTGSFELTDRLDEKVALSSFIVLKGGN